MLLARFILLVTSLTTFGVYQHVKADFGIQNHMFIINNELHVL